MTSVLPIHDFVTQLHGFVIQNVISNIGCGIIWTEIASRAVVISNDSDTSGRVNQKIKVGSQPMGVGSRLRGKSEVLL